MKPVIHTKIGGPDGTREATITMNDSGEIRVRVGELLLAIGTDDGEYVYVNGYEDDDIYIGGKTFRAREVN